jgi:hypothetical protein
MSCVAVMRGTRIKRAAQRTSSNCVRLHKGKRSLHRCINEQQEITEIRLRPKMNVAAELTFGKSIEFARRRAELQAASVKLS